MRRHARGLGLLPSAAGCALEVPSPPNPHFVADTFRLQNRLATEQKHGATDGDCLEPLLERTLTLQDCYPTRLEARGTVRRSPEQPKIGAKHRRFLKSIFKVSRNRPNSLIPS